MKRTLPGSMSCDTVVADYYTVLLKSGSYYVDSRTRERLLEARRLGGTDVTFQVGEACRCCARHHTVTISSLDVLAFIAHDDTVAAAASNVIAFPGGR